MLTAGTRIGPFEISSPVGEGGMGVVFRARDTRLGRDVAVKALPDTFATDPDRLARFQREAQVLAALNHPNIAQIYGLEESGQTRCIVMELVEGETLAGRLKRGPAAPEEALAISRQICEALEAAHEKSIIHRDLKPGNVMVQPDGKVKVLDFGLAKALETAPVASNFSNSPTLSMAATQAGVILGTAAYMSPEQAKGANADSRSDVFSFGCVLFELLTGRQAFQGETASEVLASVLVREPEFRLLPPDLNPRIYDLLRRCLEKNPKRRWQAVGDLRAELEIVAAEPYRKTETAAVAVEPKSHKWLAWALGAAIVLIVALSVPTFLYYRGAPAPGEVRFEIPVPTMPNANQIAISPDGRKVAFVASASGTPMLFVRPIDSVAAQPLPGTEGALDPFWSADSRYIGFSAGTLKKVEATGGPPQALSNLSGAGTWNADGVIVFSSGGRLHRVSAAGGVPVAITTLDASLQETAHSWPHFLPDGLHFLYLAWSGSVENRAIYVGALDSDQRTRILAVESMAAFAPPGSLLFQRQGTLFAQEFDVAALTLAGEPVRLAEGIPFSGNTGRAAFAASSGGVLIYRSGATAGNRQFVWFDRSGKQLGIAGTPEIYREFDLSPDGRQIAVERINPASSTANIWLLDWERNVSTQLTFEAFSDSGPIWSPDGLRIAFTRLRQSNDIFETKASGTGGDTAVLESDGSQRIEDWSKDGRYLVYNNNPVSAAPANDPYILPLFGDRKPFPLVQSPGKQDEPHFSFDGRWLAYHSPESGTTQVYAIAFPEADQKIQISTNGGAQARWRKDGRELYYLSLDGKLMAVDLSTAGGKIQSGIPRVLFDTGLTVSIISEQYAVTGDGQRFLFQMPLAESAPTPITAVLNWTSALKK